MSVPAKQTKRPARRPHLRRARGFGSLPTAGGGIARAAYTAVLDARLDAKPLLADANLTVRQARTPRIRIPVRNQIRFLDAVACALQDDWLGFHLAQRVDLRELGALYYVLASSASLGEALRRLARYSAIQNEGVHIACRQQERIEVAFEYVDVARLSDHHQIEFFATFLLRLCRQITGRQLSPSRVRFAHRRTRLPSEVRAFFACKMEFGTPTDEIAFPGSAGSLAVVNADPYLNSLLLKYCDDIISKRPVKSGLWRPRVENAVAPLLPHGGATIRNVADAIGVSQRTLARRLAAEGVTFAAVVKELRLDLARRYLREPDLKIADVAWLVGYQDISGFSHAIKRWTGRSPARLRASG